MENVKVGAISIGQAIKIENRKLGIKRFIQKNKLGLIISVVFCSLLSIYAVLVINFINLIKILN